MRLLYSPAGCSGDRRRLDNAAVCTRPAFLTIMLCVWYWLCICQLLDVVEQTHIDVWTRNVRPCICQCCIDWTLMHVLFYEAVWFMPTFHRLFGTTQDTHSKRYQCDFVQLFLDWKVFQWWNVHSDAVLRFWGTLLGFSKFTKYCTFTPLSFRYFADSDYYFKVQHWIVTYINNTSIFITSIVCSLLAWPCSPAGCWAQFCSACTSGYNSRSWHAEAFCPPGYNLNQFKGK